MRAARVEEAGCGDVAPGAADAPGFSLDAQRGRGPVVVLREQATGEGRVEEETMAEGASVRLLRERVARVRGRRRVVVPEGLQSHERPFVEDGRAIRRVPGGVARRRGLV